MRPFYLIVIATGLFSEIFVRQALRVSNDALATAHQIKPIKMPDTTKALFITTANSNNPSANPSLSNSAQAQNAQIIIDRIKPLFVNKNARGHFTKAYDPATFVKRRSSKGNYSKYAGIN